MVHRTPLTLSGLVGSSWSHLEGVPMLKEIFVFPVTENVVSLRSWHVLVR